MDSFFVVYCEDYDLEVMARHISDKKTLVQIERNIEPKTLQVFDMFFAKEDDDQPDAGLFWMAMMQDQKFIVDKFQSIDQNLIKAGKAAREKAAEE